MRDRSDPARRLRVLRGSDAAPAAGGPRPRDGWTPGPAEFGPLPGPVRGRHRVLRRGRKADQAIGGPLTGDPAGDLSGRDEGAAPVAGFGLDSERPDPWWSDSPAGDDLTVDQPDPADLEPGSRPAAGLDSPAHRVRELMVGPWGRLARKWVPEPLQDARVDPGRRGAAVLLVVAVVAAVVTAVGVWRDRPVPRPVQSAVMASATIGSAGSAGIGSSRVGSGGAGSIRASSGVPGSIDAATGSVHTGSVRPDRRPSSASAVAAPDPTVIFVSITGAVRRPGLVQLPSGSRVADAVTAAGGATAEAELTGLNLAARLADGDSVVVGIRSAQPGSVVGTNPAPVSGPDPAAPAPGGGAAPVNLNTADQAALEALPGVGPVMAGNILAWRTANGRFTSIEQLQEISGIGPARYAQLAALVTL